MTGFSVYFSPIESEGGSSKTMNEEEALQLAADKFEGKVVPYWKLKNPPKLAELRARKPKDVSQLAIYAQEIKARKYWERKAKELCETPNVTVQEIRTALCGTTHSKTLTKKLKEQLKRAK